MVSDWKIEGGAQQSIGEVGHVSVDDGHSVLCGLVAGVLVVTE